jgi:hypothetical protein
VQGFPGGARLTLKPCCAAVSQPASAICFRSMSLGPRLTALQVMRTRARQSSRRLASASAEKPPNTTLCTAPMRAQASMAMGSWHTMGM